MTTEGSAELASQGVEVCLGERVLEIGGPSRTVRTAFRRLEFDSLVICTGTRAASEAPRGVSKKDVFLMKAPEDYLRFHRSRREWSRISVIGSPPVSLAVAASLATRGKVSVYVGRNGLGRFPAPITEMIREAAWENGLELKENAVDAIVGGAGVEAVLSDGEVYASDCAVVLPRRVPDLPKSDAALGLHGGVLTDSSARTSVKGIFAAGDCCEVRVGAISLPTRLRSASSLMGEVAGLNSTGAAVRASLSYSMPVEFLGLEILLTGLSLDDALAAGFPARRAETGREGEFPYISVVYDANTHRTLGVQAAGVGVLSLSGLASIAISSSLTLETLAFQESAFAPFRAEGVSPIRLTAGKALAEAQERAVETKGTRVRHN